MSFRQTMFAHRTRTKRIDATTHAICSYSAAVHAKTKGGIHVHSNVGVIILAFIALTNCGPIVEPLCSVE